MFQYTYPRPAVTVDAVIFRKSVTGAEVLLIRRLNPPFEGMWAVPGGFVDMDENLDSAALRELAEETGIKGVPLFQFYTFGDVNRDPRHRTISVAYAGFLRNSDQAAVAADDAAAVGWFSLQNLPPMAFDHALVIEKAIAFAKSCKWF